MTTISALPAAVAASIVRWIQRNVFGLVMLAVLLVAWQYLSMTIDRIEAYFPSPAYTFQQTFANPDLIIGGFQKTMSEIVIGFVFAVIIGISLGLILSEFRLVRQITMSPILFLHTIPLVILAPLFIIWFGTGLVGIGLYVAWGGFFPIFINSITGFSQIRTEFRHLGEITGATRWQMIRYIKFWAAVPSIASGVRITANIVVIATIIAEFIASGSGLGHLIILSSYQGRAGQLFGVFFIIIFVGVAWYSFVSFLVRFINPVSNTGR